MILLDQNIKLSGTENNKSGCIQNAIFQMYNGNAKKKT